MSAPRNPIVKLSVVAALSAVVLICCGCLRSRLASDDAGFRDAPGMPKQDFGRPGQRLGQMGLDSRSREIESSLGVEGEPPRLLDR